MIRLVIVAEICFYREGIARYLEAVEGIDIAGATATPEDAVELVRRLEPDLVVLDVVRPEIIEGLRLIRRAAPDTRVVAIGLPEFAPTIVSYAEEGIAGYVSREASLAELEDAILHAARDELVCPPSLASTLLRRVGALAAQARPARPRAELTSREREIVTLIERGHSNKEIAKELHIEVTTVKNHVHNIFEKLRVSRRSEAAALYRRGAV